MKLIVLAIIILSLYLIYRLLFSGQPGNRPENEAPPSKPADTYETVTKSRFTLPERRNSPKHDGRPEVFEKEAEKPDTFAAGNELSVAIPPDELDEIFGKDVDPDELEIERDANETDGNEDLDAEEEIEEIQEPAKETEGYAAGFTFDELTTAFRQTDLFEELISGDAGRTAQIAALLDRSEQSFTGEDEEAVDGDGQEYRDFDMSAFLS
jgi:hypothetical protein